MGLLYPQHVMASHINMVRGHALGFLSHPILAIQYALAPYSQREKDGYARSNWML